MAIVVAEKIIEMFFIMLCGIDLFKTGLIDDKTVPRLSNILLMLVSPLMIFQSYQMDFDGHLMWGLGLTLIAALTTFTVIIILTNILIRNTEYSRNGISISSAYNLQKNKIPDNPQETIRAHIYKKIGVKSERVEKGVYPSLKQVKSKSDAARRQSRASAAYISNYQKHYSSK